MALGAAGLTFDVTDVRSDPAWGDVFTLEQPDGSRVEVRIWGDEYYRVVESLDGYTLVRDPGTGIICYARLSQGGEGLESTGLRFDRVRGEITGLERHLRINAEARQRIIRQKRDEKLEQEIELLSLPGMPQRIDPPCNGNVAGICLIVDFSDEPATIPAADINNYCNQVGYTGYGNNGSVRDYFYDVSDGNLTYTNYVPAVYYRAIYPKSYYDDCSAPYGQRAREMIIEALNNLNNNGFDFSAYDSNGDQIIDAINCFYAGVTSCGWASGLWPHSGTVTFNADGVHAYRYQVTSLGTSLRLATFCHENGHMIGFWPDLYDYDHDSAGVGRFCIMCSYTSSTNPQEPCAYLKYMSGWASTTLLTTPQAGLTAPSTSNTVYKYEHPILPTEYYLVENRQKSGRDSGLPDAGLAIWHIDEYGSNSNQDMTPSSHYEATLVQADGNWDLENNVNTGDGTDLWSAPGYTECSSSTDPSTQWWDGSQSLLALTNISANSAVMTFDYGPSPDAEFTADVTAGCAPFTVNFTDLSPEPVLSWIWSFGDGDSAFVQHPSHVYTSPGTYTVGLRITTSEGSGTETKFNYITVPTGKICQVEPIQLDFGSVVMYESRDLTFIIGNVGCETLTGTVSEPCTPYSLVSGGGPYSLAPFESLMVTVRFTPSYVGAQNCWVNTGDAMCADVLCTGTGLEPPPACSVDPDTVDFGTLAVGNFKTMSFNITNTGYGMLTGTVSETHDLFAIISTASYALQHGQTHVVNVAFVAGYEGTFECVVETGNSLCQDVLCKATAGTPAVCVVEPDTLSFGLVAVDDSKDQSFFVTNTGGGLLAGTVSDTCSYFDVVSGAGPYSLAGGDTLHVVVRYSPKSAGESACFVETGLGGCADVFCRGSADYGGLAVRDVVPDKLFLFQNHPNPFNPATTITFALPEQCRVSLIIYDVNGALVKTLFSGVLDPGVKQYPWNGTDSWGNPVSSGVYFYRLKAGSDALTRKMVLLK